jgi:tryptophan-rich sensory protein
MTETVIAALPLVLGLGVGAVTPMHPEWYATLAKPSWNPPGWVFGPVWTVLYVLMGLAARRVFLRTGPNAAAMLLFAIQLGLNIAWSPVFFGQKNPRRALLILGLLVVAALATTVAFATVDRAAAWMLAPYLVWLLLAYSLNRAVVEKNPGV